MMKKILHIALLSAILLLGSYGTAWGAKDSKSVNKTIAEIKTIFDTATGTVTLGEAGKVWTITDKGTITLTQHVNLLGPIAINVDVTIVPSKGSSRNIIYKGSGETDTDGSPVNSMFRVRTGAKLTIKGNNNDERVYLCGGEYANWTNPPADETKLTATSLTPKAAFKSLDHGAIYSIGTLVLELVSIRDVYNGGSSGGSYGGAITIANNASSGPTTLSGVQIYRCVAPTGAAIFMVGADVVVDAEKTKVSLLKKNTTGTVNGVANTSVVKETLIYNCKTTSGSGMIRTNGHTDASLYMDGAIIRYCYSSSYGGAIHWNAAGTANTICQMRGCHFHNNVANGSGGALFMESSFEFLTDNTTGNKTRFQYNDSTSYGGGVCVNSYSGGAHGVTDYEYIFGNNVMFRRNNGNHGGGLAFTFKQGTIANGSTVTVKIDGAEFTENVSKRYGGGIYLDKDDAATQYTMSTKFISGTVSGNTANDVGGGLYIRNIELKSDNSANDFTVDSNTSTNQGGGLYVMSADITFNNIKITNNKSLNEFSGGLYARNSNVTIENADVSGNQAAKSGGGMRINNGSEDDQDKGIANKVVTINNGTFNDNVSGTYGGAIYIDGGKVNINKGEFSGNTATNDGGAVYADSKSFNPGIVNIGTATFSGNTARNGGGVYVNGATYEATMNINSTASFTNNHATVTEDIADGVGGGGGIFVNKGNLNISGAATFTDNTSTKRGAGFYVDKGNLYITSETAANISSNESNLAGAGFFVRLGNVNIKNATISNNRAASHGGGFYVIGSDDGTKGLVTIDEVRLEGNQANYNNNTGKGGAICLEKGGLTITKSATLRENSATGFGGGIYATNANVEIEAASLTSNSAPNGGGIYTQGDGTLGNISITNATFDQNHATAGSGGGVYVNTADLNIKTLASFTGNTSTVSGGAMYATGGNVEITTASLLSNQAANGGGMYVDNGNINITSKATITTNTATTAAGGGVYLASGDIVIADADISGNTASTKGGGICLNGGTITITKGDIKNNTAGTFGGGLHAESDSAKTITLAGGGVFSNNEAETCGGGISVSGPITFNTSGTIESNSAKNGGGIYLTGGATMNFNEGMIRYNRATGTTGSAFTTANLKTANQVYGVGGGVFVEQNSNLLFKIGSTTFGLYGNTATMAADDIFANGDGTTVQIPQVDAMTLNDFNVTTSRLLWAEDYMNGDTGYENGMKIIPDWDNLPDKFEQVLRYKGAQSILALRELVFTGTSLTLPRAVGATYPPGPANYVCLTLGYNNTSVKITRTGLKAGESAIFTYTRAGDSEPMGRIVLTGVGEDVPVSKWVVLSDGTWIIAENSWSYTYNVTAPSITRTITVSSTEQERTFTFASAKESAPAHDEKKTVNALK